MCGIVGIKSLISSQKVDLDDLTRMRDFMDHRGPDSAGHWVSDDADIALGHRRLSIVDLAPTAEQPMPNNDSSIHIVFNGEIYNHDCLRRELIEYGHHFRTDHSDTEVLVIGYEHWGLDGLLERINGDYAFGIWDSKKQLLSFFCG